MKIGCTIDRLTINQKTMALEKVKAVFAKWMHVDPSLITEFKVEGDSSLLFICAIIKHNGGESGLNWFHGTGEGVDSARDWRVMKEVNLPTAAKLEMEEALQEYRRCYTTFPTTS